MQAPVLKADQKWCWPLREKDIQLLHAGKHSLLRDVLTNLPWNGDLCEHKGLFDLWLDFSKYSRTWKLKTYDGPQFVEYIYSTYTHPVSILLSMRWSRTWQGQLHRWFLASYIYCSPLILAVADVSHSGLNWLHVFYIMCTRRRRIIVTREFWCWTAKLRINPCRWWPCYSW